MHECFFYFVSMRVFMLTVAMIKLFVQRGWLTCKNEIGNTSSWVRDQIAGKRFLCQKSLLVRLSIHQVYPLLRVKSPCPKKWVSWVWHQTTSDGKAPSCRDLESVELFFVAITPKSTLLGSHLWVKYMFKNYLYYIGILDHHITVQKSS